MLDKNGGYSFFFSGAEPDKYFDMIAAETNTMLMSYHHLKRKGKKFMRERVEQCPEMKLFIDSGAFTFLNKEGYDDKGAEHWEKYIDEYLKFVRENKEHIFAIADLDIDGVVGVGQVDKWRKEYFEPLKEEGIQVCYIWHSERGIAGWEEMCKKYDYVGISFSSDSNDDKVISKMFNIAKKYKTKIHGMAVNGLHLLTTFPWYTSDASTWLVGTQYGEISYFDGRKLSRLKKDKWKRQYKNKIIQLGGNWKLLEREDPYELQRVNIITFVRLEEYVRKRMKAKWYWLNRENKSGGLFKKLSSKKAPTEEVEDEGEELPRGHMPPDDDSWHSEWKKWARAIGLDDRVEDEVGIKIIEVFRDFICYNSQMLQDKYSAEDIYELCDEFKIETNTVSKAIPQLKEAFKAHAIGERNDFANYSEEAAKGDAPEKAKEREEYIEDNNTVIVDMDKKECDLALVAFLPPGQSDMPEVDAYDEELKKMDITVVRDEKGRFLKGQRTIRNPKKIYSDMLPKLACDTCYKAGECPEYRPGYVCAYNKIFSNFDTRNLGDIADAMYSIVNANIARMQRMMLFETMDGGQVDANVTQLMDINMKYLQQIKEMNNSKAIVHQKLVVNDRGDVEQTTSVTSNGQAGGILAQLFGGGLSAEKPPAKEGEIIDITPEEHYPDEDDI